MAGTWEPFGMTRRLAEEAARSEPPAPTGAAPATPASAEPPAPTGAPRPARRSRRRPTRPEPAQQLVVITCMDARIDPLAILGLSVGDAHVIRNAGATISDDVLRSLHLSQSRLGTRRALLIGHTDCAGYPSDAAAATAVREGLRRIQSSAAVPDGFTLEGLIYDVRTGSLTPVG
jgi:carbonic anhydrase